MSRIDPALNQAVFLHVAPASGTLFDFLADRHPTLVCGWRDSVLRMGDGATHFGLVGGGRATLTCDSGSYCLNTGMYFAVPGLATIEGSGYGVVASIAGYLGLFQIGGPVEGAGRLRYIDGCSDTLLIAPPLLGDPCLNLLHIPPHTNQTAHTHPSLRVGMVLEGEGYCRIPGENYQLSPGLIFAIRTGGLHSFHTAKHALRIVAWHPDSDYGPTHDEHPMLNRTLVSGLPVNAPGRHR